MAQGYTLDRRPLTLSCPECGSPMYPMDDTVVPSFTCHIGHKLTGAAMLSAQRNRLEYGLCMILLNSRNVLSSVGSWLRFSPMLPTIWEKSLTRQRKALGIRNVLEREWVISDQRVL